LTIRSLPEKRNVCGVLAGTPEGMNHLADLGIRERMIVKWSLNRMG
jgi:hypothetical protein